MRPRFRCRGRVARHCFAARRRSGQADEFARDHLLHPSTPRGAATAPRYPNRRIRRRRSCRGRCLRQRSRTADPARPRLHARVGSSLSSTRSAFPQLCCRRHASTRERLLEDVREAWSALHVIDGERHDFCTAQDHESALPAAVELQSAAWTRRCTKRSCVASGCSPTPRAGCGSDS